MKPFSDSHCGVACLFMWVGGGALCVFCFSVCRILRLWENNIICIIYFIMDVIAFYFISYFYLIFNNIFIFNYAFIL